jgi:YVTN family beta-propeller protein
MITRVTALLVVTLSMWALTGSSGQGGTKPALLVLAKSDHTLAVVDPITFQVRGTAPSGPDPHEVVVSGDGRVAYISNYNGGGNIISVVDLTSMQALPAIDLGPLRAPHGLVFTGGKLWFTAEGAKVIGSYDPAARKVDWVLGTGQNRTHMIYVWNDLGRIVTSNVSSATLTIIEKTTGGGRGSGPPPGIAGRGPTGPPDRGGAPGPPAGGRGPGGPPQPDWDETQVAVGRGAEGFDVSPDAREIWAANAQDGTISIVDVATKRVTDTLAADVGGANRLKFTPDGRMVLVSTLSGPDLTIIDAATHGMVKRLRIGHGAAGIQMQPDGARAYVACTPDDDVVVVDLKTLAVVGHIAAGKQPDGLAFVR